jgi:hypothetical protein
VFRSATQQGELGIESLHLAPGSHSSPREGVCVVELASLLAGEKFSDHPRCVCVVIAGFLRSLNDRVAHADRQRLRPYAGRAVGSRSARQISRQRRDACLAAAGVRLEGGRIRRLLGRLAIRARIFFVVGLRPAMRLNRGAGEYAARAVFARNGAEEAFALLDRLLAVGALEAAPLADPVHGATQARVAAAIRQLVRDAQVAEGENGRQGANHNGHANHLGERNPGQGDKEGVESDHAGYDDPERESELTEDLHDLARVP